MQFRETEVVVEGALAIVVVVARIGVVISVMVMVQESQNQETMDVQNVVAIMAQTAQQRGGGVENVEK